MINLFLFIAGIFLFTFLAGKLLEKIRVPWIFAALILGAVVSLFSYFSGIVQSDTFTFLATLGMYFLLFIIGFEIDLKEITKKGGFLFKSTFFIISFEAIIGALLFHFVFGYPILISFLIGFSFATVGEAVLIPILDEFKLVNTKLGQSILGIGVLDDIIEIAVLIIVVGFIGLDKGQVHIWVIIPSLISLFLLTFVLRKISEKTKKFKFQNIESIFLFLVFILFLFVGIGNLAEAAPLAAFLAGISIRTFIPKERLRFIEKETKSIAYGFFAPIFFFWVGTSMNLSSLIGFPLLLLLILIVSVASKLIASWIVSKGYFSFKESTLLGIGLSVRFSTSIIILKILLDSGLLNPRLYSILIASSIVLTFIVPILFSWLIIKWKIKKKG